MSKQPKPTPGDHGYDLDDDSELNFAEDVPPVSPVPADATRRPKRQGYVEESSSPSSSAAEAPADTYVEQVWTRGAEWGPTLAVLAVTGVVILFLLYLSLSPETIGLTFLILMVGGATMAILSYPIVITLERPVRITPEQAVKDFYHALSHHVPHYRRMWLLLSERGRTSGSYGSFEGFRNYWKKRQAALRGSTVKSTTPLAFQIEEFKAEKSAGKSYLTARYSVVVHARGQRDRGPLATIRVGTSLVKGPDGMWYLNDGTLPEPRRERED